MASDDEAGPSNKRIKLITAEPIMDVRDMNKSFLKIDNLEHFPLKVLLNIFAKVDDIGLYNLAETSTRFEKIARIVLNERYTHRYFLVDESKTEWKQNDYHCPNLYVSFFQRFGKEIKAIEIKNITIYNESPWIVRLLDETENLKKLTLEQCQIYYGNLLQHAGMQITHLKLRNSNASGRFDLPEYRNLKKLEIWIQSGRMISIESMTEIFRNNPALESFVLGEKSGTYSSLARQYPFGELMNLIGTHLNQLKELTYICNKPNDWDEIPNQQPQHFVDAFVRSLQHLESITLSSNIENHTNFFGLLRHLNSANIKHLKLYDVDAESSESFDVIKLFNRIESFAVRFINFVDDDDDKSELLSSMIEHLPHLRHLTLDLNCSIDLYWITLELLERSLSLEKLTIEYDYEDGEIEKFGTAKFYAEFIESIRNQNVKLEVKLGCQNIGFVSKNEVVWRNKLMHWMGYNPDQNSSGINLLDLNMEPNANVKSNPFDLVLGYLDLNSLYALSKANEKCSQLVMNHVKQHSQQQGTFTLTNECNEGSNYDVLEMFAEYVLILRVEVFHQEIDALQELLKKFHNLTKLYIYAEAFLSPVCLIVPQVRYLIYDGLRFNEYLDLYDLSCECPDLKELKLIKGMRGDLRQRGERLKFRKLKKFNVKHNDHIHNHLNELKDIFKDTNTELTLTI